MYVWIWRKLPGGLAGKLTGTVLLALTAVALLFFVVFPLVEPRLPFNDVTVNGPASTAPSPPSPSATSPSVLPGR